VQLRTPHALNSVGFVQRSRGSSFRMAAYPLY